MQGLPIGPVGDIEPTAPSEGGSGGKACPQGDRVRRPFLFYLLALGVLCLDQASKLAVVSMLAPREPYPVIGGILDLTYVTNTGGAFSVLPWATSALAAVAGVVAIGLLLSGPRLAQAGRLVEAAAAMLLGGAVGNLVDRLRLGHVIDFIDLQVWPIFNVADIGITVGAILFIIAALRMPGAAPGPEQE